MEHIQYQLEEKMGDGKWSRVYETKEEADYESPSYKSFPTAELAREYANKGSLRWSAGALDRKVVRVVVVTTTVAVLEDPPVSKKGSRHYHAKDALLELDWCDSIFDLRLFLTDDGRKRGLWVWLEEDAKRRVENDAEIFNEGFKKFVEHLKKKKYDFANLKPEQGFDFIFSLKLYFDYFFSHRTEAAAIRLSWKQVKKLEAALKKEHAAEKNKTEEDY